MRKHRLYFTNLFLLLFILSIANCTREVALDANESTFKNISFTVEVVDRVAIQNNQSLSEKLSKFFKKKGQNFSNDSGRMVYNESLGFIVDIESAIYIEDGSHHSYTFSMFSDEMNLNILENFVLNSNGDGTYEANIYQYQLDGHVDYSQNLFHNDISSYTKIILADDLDFANEILNRSDDPCRIDYWSGPGSNGYYVSEEECNEMANGPCTIHHSVVNQNCDENDTDEVEDNTDDGGSSGTAPSSVDVYVYNGAGGYETWDPTTNYTSGNNTSGDNNIDFSVPNTVPKVDISMSIVKSLNLSITLDGDLIRSINNSDNYEVVYDVYNLLEDNTENGYVSDSIIIEAIMTLEVEFANEWDYSQFADSYLGREALGYVATSTPSNNNGVMYLLENGKVLYVTQTPRAINYEDNLYIMSNEETAYHYIYDPTVKEWYEYILPEAIYDCLSCDIELFFQSVLENGGLIVGRYILPIEDWLIVITGEDFYGVEQSRAVAGAFILMDIIPGSELLKCVKLTKYGDEVIDATQVAVKFIDEIYKSQKNNVRDVLEGIIDLNAFGNNIRKGNFGEMVTDVNLYEKGYEPLHIRRTNIDESLNHGIDGVFQNPQSGEYIIVESKYNYGNLNQLTNDGAQMSDDWIQGANTGFDRLTNEVGEELANEIYLQGYTRVVANIKPNGEIVFKLLDENGQYIVPGKWINDWTP